MARLNCKAAVRPLGATALPRYTKLANFHFKLSMRLKLKLDVRVFQTSDQIVRCPNTCIVLTKRMSVVRRAVRARRVSQP